MGNIKAVFGTNIKYYRKKQHLTQEQLAENLGVSVARLFCKENENLYDDNVLSRFDRITEKHIIGAMEGIKGEIRKDILNS